MREDMMDIINFACQRHKCNLITNGTLISKEIAQQLVANSCKNIFSPGLTLINVSLQGPEQLHDEITTVKGSYQKAIQTVYWLRQFRGKRRFPLLDISTVIFEKTIPTLSKMVLSAEDLGVDIVSFLLQVKKPHNQSATSIGPVLLRELTKIKRLSQKLRTKIRFSPASITDTEIIKYYQNEVDLKSYVCYAPWYAAQISPYGEFGCPNYSTGNIRKIKLNGLWNSSELRKFRQKFRKGYLPPSCAGCCELVKK